ncbi:hypothetical protein [Ktedonobacter robiniae]|uniref:hypothetical protein n=1 Tax=Ktedonobacter robiniae TaxID=2778365 RepID=UPI001F2EF5DF|nr:hypothetical protein [Ktedonobacter robiniae]
MFHASHRIYAGASTHGLLLLDPLASAEQARVITQYHMLASALKEPLPELEELAFTTSTSPHLILDLGCGPGGTWACDVAFDDHFCLVFGVSALAPPSGRLIPFARCRLRHASNFSRWTLPGSCAALPTSSRSSTVASYAPFSHRLAGPAAPRVLACPAPRRAPPPHGMHRRLLK